MVQVAIITRRLREGKTYDDFSAAPGSTAPGSGRRAATACTR